MPRQMCERAWLSFVPESHSGQLDAYHFNALGDTEGVFLLGICLSWEVRLVSVPDVMVLLEGVGEGCERSLHGLEGEGGPHG